MKMFKLGTIVTDSVSGTRGMLTHVMCAMNASLQYVYQPSALHPKTLQPVSRVLLNPARVEGGEEIEVEIPLHLLGTQAEDLATGFQGTIVELVMHINGCIHVEIKPSGTNPETGSTIEAHEFDLRRLKGDAIEPLEGEALEQSRKNKPSPEPFKNLGK
jgi:hypothetical protein